MKTYGSTPAAASNGSVMDKTADAINEELDKRFGVTFSSGKVKVATVAIVAVFAIIAVVYLFFYSNLTLEKFNPAEHVDVVYQGTNGNGTADLSIGSSMTDALTDSLGASVAMQFSVGAPDMFDISADKTEGLSNGDVITITVKAKKEAVKTFEDYGLKIKETSTAKMKVKGLE